MERAKGVEPSTFSLATRRSTTELCPQKINIVCRFFLIQVILNMVCFYDEKEELPQILSIFPLSNFIIFPKTTVPLNIFEPRYIDMINDSMK